VRVNAHADGGAAGNASDWSDDQRTDHACEKHCGERQEIVHHG
jgi:hypothetical protein